MKYICPVCYYPNLDEYPDRSYEICPCCSTEFGNDDSIYSHEELRERWISNGKKFWAAEHEKMSADDIKIYELLQDEMVDCFLTVEIVKALNLNILRADEIRDCMLLSEEVLGRDWLTPEEDEAWKNL